MLHFINEPYYKQTYSIERGVVMAKYTQQAIMYSLLKLLQEKPIDKITVKDICE